MNDNLIKIIQILKKTEKSDIYYQNDIFTFIKSIYKIFKKKNKIIMFKYMIETIKRKSFQKLGLNYSDELVLEMYINKKNRWKY